MDVRSHPRPSRRRLGPLPVRAAVLARLMRKLRSRSVEPNDIPRVARRLAAALPVRVAVLSRARPPRIVPLTHAAVPGLNADPPPSPIAPLSMATADALRARAGEAGTLPSGLVPADLHALLDTLVGAPFALPLTPADLLIAGLRRSLTRAERRLVRAVVRRFTGAAAPQAPPEQPTAPPLLTRPGVEAVLTHMSDGFMLANSAGVVTVVNAAARTMLGVEDRISFNEADYWDAMTADGLRVAAADLPLSRALAGDRGAARELVTLVGNDARVISVSAAPLSGPDGEARGAVAILRDVTDVRRAQERAAEGERLRAAGEMASGVAHDFNNLLAVILGQCELLLAPGAEQPSVEELAAQMKIIRQAALDGAATVKRLQAFSGVHRAAAQEAMNPSDVLRDVVEFARPRWKDAAQQRGATITVQVGSDPIPLMEGSPVELREVLVNMVFNAVDAMPSGGTITLSATLYEGEVRIGVRDTGVGMSDEVRRRVFEPFFTTKGTRGAGLGLAMSYGIIAGMGGRIEVESALYSGTIFTIVLPFREARVMPAIGTRRADGPLSLLVVDDEPQVLRTTRMMAEVEGHRVSTAESGARALELLHDGDFDAILTDLGMPGMNGVQLVSAVRAAGYTIPCILVTGWGMELTSEDVRMIGAQAVLSKPFTVSQLRDMLARTVPTEPEMGGEGFGVA